MCVMYCMYIRTSACVYDRINIPYGMRAQYTHLYRNPESTLLKMSFEERITVFDDCFAELVKLLRDSFSRFVKTHTFEKCVEILMTSHSP